MYKFWNFIKYYFMFKLFKTKWCATTEPLFFVVTVFKVTDPVSGNVSYDISTENFSTLENARHYASDVKMNFDLDIQEQFIFKSKEVLKNDL